MGCLVDKRCCDGEELLPGFFLSDKQSVTEAFVCVSQHIMTEPEEITTMSGQKLPLKMSVDYISFSAHTDYQQTSEFIRALKPPHVVIRLQLHQKINNRRQNMCPKHFSPSLHVFIRRMKTWKKEKVLINVAGAKILMSSTFTSS